MNNYEKIICGIGVCVIILIIAFFTFMFMDADYYHNALVESCEKINMDYEVLNGNTICIDNNDIAHLVVINCEGSLKNYDCNARMIKFKGIK